MTTTDTLTRWVLAISRAKRQAGESEAALVRVIGEARKDGCSWELIAGGLGVSRQAAWSTWHDRVAEVE